VKELLTQFRWESTARGVDVFKVKGKTEALDYGQFFCKYSLGDLPPYVVDYVNYQ
jgi:hypothetical protein